MKTAMNIGAIAIGLSLALDITVAQTPAQPPAQQSSSPAAASSPHQRETTGQSTAEAPTNPSPEAAAASSAHQREVTAGTNGAKLPDQSGADPATFVLEASQAGMTEVRLGKVALSKTHNPSISAFADRMVKDHGKANVELAAIAKRKGFEIPADLDAKHAAVVQKLNSQSGAEFDGSYVTQMMADHDKAVALFEGAAKNTDAELAAFARKTLPTLKEHERMADALSAGPR